MRIAVLALFVMAGCKTAGFDGYPRTSVQLGHVGKVTLAKYGDAKPGGLVKFTAKGPGRLSVDTENAADVTIFKDDGTELVGSGVPPVSIARLLPGTYYVGVTGKDGAQVLVRTKFFPDDPEGDSGPDAKPDGAIELRHGVTHWGLVSAPELDRTDFLRCEVGEEEELTLSAQAIPPDAAEISLLMPDGEEHAWGARAATTFEDPAPGSYVVQVRAKDARDARYAVRCFGSRDDPERASGSDGNIDGAKELVWAQESPQDSVATVRDAVDFAMGDGSDWYVLRAPADGTCDVQLTEGRASLSATTADERAPEMPKHELGKRRCGPQPMWIRVSAENEQQSGDYVLSVRFHAEGNADTE